MSIALNCTVQFALHWMSVYIALNCNVYIALVPRAYSSDPRPLLPGSTSPPPPPHIVGYILPSSFSHPFATMDHSYSKSQKGSRD